MEINYDDGFEGGDANASDVKGAMKQELWSNGETIMYHKTHHREWAMKTNMLGVSK